jgi:hypothetical protein
LPRTAFKEVSGIKLAIKKNVSPFEKKLNFYYIEDIPPMVETAKAVATDIGNADKLQRWRAANDQVSFNFKTFIPLPLSFWPALYLKVCTLNETGGIGAGRQGQEQQ